jgi:KaiC/GvpD/RAD55 family RecA-like ATPase
MARGNERSRGKAKSKDEAGTTERVPTGTLGLDKMTGGGFPRGTVNLITGPTGSGKTLFGLNFLIHGASELDEGGIYLSLEERRESLLRAAEGFQLSVRSLEVEGKLVIVDMATIREKHSVIEDSRREVASLSAIQEFLSNYLIESDARRLVIDSITAAGLYTKDPLELRQELFRLCNFLREFGITTIMITDQSVDKGLTRYDIEQLLADSFIVMELEDMGKGLRRSLVIRKMRYTDHDVERHPYIIRAGGIQVMHEEEIY